MHLLNLKLVAHWRVTEEFDFKTMAEVIRLFTLNINKN